MERSKRDRGNRARGWQWVDAAAGNGATALACLLPGILLLALGCASTGRQIPRETPGRILAVVLIEDPNPCGWPDPNPALSPLQAGNAGYLLYLLQREAAALPGFERVVRYDEGEAGRVFAPALELAMQVAWFGRDLSPGEVRKAGAGRQLPDLGAGRSERGLGERCGLLMRFELKDLRTSKLVAQWCSFAEATFDGRVPVMLQSFIEEPFRQVLAAAADSLATPRPLSAAFGTQAIPHVDNTATVVQGPPGSGIQLAGRSSYQLQREFLRPPQSMAEAEGNPVYAFFGTTNEGVARAEAATVHEEVLGLLAKVIEKSPLGLVRWQGDYRLAFDVMALDFDFSRATGTDRGQVTCTAQVGVSLQRLSDQQVLRQQAPPLIIQFYKEQLGGRQSLDDLKMQVAEALKDWLNEYWFELRGE